MSTPKHDLSNFVLAPSTDPILVPLRDSSGAISGSIFVKITNLVSGLVRSDWLQY